MGRVGPDATPSPQREVFARLARPPCPSVLCPTSHRKKQMSAKGDSACGENISGAPFRGRRHRALVAIAACGGAKVTWVPTSCYRLSLADFYARPLAGHVGLINSSPRASSLPRPELTVTLT
eukprot:6172845-Pleurochrysis_carterae.AAC.1